MKTKTKYTTSRKAPFKCNDCDWEGSSLQAVSMHWNRMHGPKAATWKANQKAGVSSAAKGNGSHEHTAGPKVSATIANRSRTPMPPYICNVGECTFETDSIQYLGIHQRQEHGLKLRGKKSKHTPAPVANGRIAPEPTTRTGVKFCPACSYNVHVIAAAMHLVEPGDAVRFCPRCGCNIHAVSLALHHVGQ